MLAFIARVGRFSFAWFIGFFLASIFHTQAVIGELTAIGIDVSLSERFSTSYQDLFGLLPSYGPVLFIGFLIAFVVTWLIRRKLPGKSVYWFAIAGAVAMFVIIISMQPLLNVTLLAGARTSIGFALQVLAGFIAGFVYGKLRSENSASDMREK